VEREEGEGEEEGLRVRRLLEVVRQFVGGAPGEEEGALPVQPPQFGGAEDAAPERWHALLLALARRTAPPMAAARRLAWDLLDPAAGGLPTDAGALGRGRRRRFRAHSCASFSVSFVRLKQSKQGVAWR
jgi:hypothetical protein